MSLPTAAIRLDQSMKQPLDSFVTNLSYFTRVFGNTDYGELNWIGHLGGPPGGLPRNTYHNVGKALDISWLHWEGGNVSRPYHAAAEVKDTNGWKHTTHRRLVAVEAGLRKWFGYVLNRGISNHDNHFHVDNGCPAALRLKSSSSSRTHTSCHFFMQDCIYAFTDEKIEYNGNWDDSSKRACKTLLSDLGMECLNPAKYVSHYMLFLDYIMMHGFADAPAGTYRWGDSALVL
ncbi:MAG: hypothetical protein OXI96_06125 [Acidimicrobiaceae bacterium]|nr:hypothetical protein [Acidimicrobiaceae bacterium]